MPGFEMNIEPRPNWTIARLHGEASLTESTPLETKLRQITDQRQPNVILDLTDLSFIDSSALGILVQFRHDVQKYGGRIRLVGAQRHITDVFRKTRLVELFPMFDSADEAITETPS